MEKKFRILVINPGSTSTKVAVYDGSEVITTIKMAHSKEELAPFPNVFAQLDYRREIIFTELAKAGIDIDSLDIVMGRGGLLQPIPSGIYEVDEAMIHDLRHATREHASNLGGLLAREIANRAGVGAYIADPVVVDELDDVARFTGLPQIKRLSIFHPLNQKAVARRYAASIGKRYEELNLIVAHMGGGITIGAHRQGRVVDVNNGLGGEGPLSPERAGSLPADALVDLCFSGDYTLPQIKRMLVGEGGLTALVGTTNVQELVERTEAGDEKAREALDAMSYQTGRWIGGAAAVLHGAVDAIILTGGVAYNKPVTDYIAEMVSFITPVVVIPGEDELEALASNALRLLTGKAIARDYKASILK
jgi:butyrate kinase